MLNRTREKIEDGVYLNVINTDKFKTELISFYIILPLDKNEVTSNTLIPLVLKRGTEKYNTSMEIERRLEELYGSDLSVSVSKKGEKQTIRFTIEGPREDFVSSNEILRNKLEVLNEIIYKPLIKQNGFIEKYVLQEKKNLKDRIASRINDKKQYAVTRCIEEMCKNEPYSIYKYGYIEDLEDITPSNLYNHYLSILKKARIEISIVSNIQEDKIKQLITEYFSFGERDSLSLEREKVIFENVDEETVQEKMDINQGKLTLGFRTNIPYEDDLYSAFLVGNYILGGGPDSKLFVNVREKESLAYYIYSKAYKYKSLMLISAGIEFNKYDDALNIIKEQVKSVKKGEFEEKDINQSKKAMVTSIKTVGDDTFSISEFYLSRVLSGDDKDIDELIEAIENVKKEDIIKAMDKISLDTVYFLKNQ